MKKASLHFWKILIIANLSVFLVTIIVSSASINYIKREITKVRAQSQKISYEPLVGILQAGTVGEIKRVNNGGSADISVQSLKTPPVIFNTTGTILEVKNDRLTVKGDGSNFADGVSRDLDVVFTPQTSVFARIGEEIARYDGLKGLEYLNTGNNVLIEGEENVRGKIQFRAKTINAL